MRVGLAPPSGSKERAARVLTTSGNRLLGYAHRWAVSPAAGVSDAYVFDAAQAVLNEHTSDNDAARRPRLATTERRMRHGVETSAVEFTLPVTLEESVRALQQFARRFADGRGHDAANTVNDVTRGLLETGFRVHEAQPGDAPILARGRGAAMYGGRRGEAPSQRRRPHLGSE